MWSTICLIFTPNRVVSLPVLFINSDGANPSMGGWDWGGLAIFVLGFFFEVGGRGKAGEVPPHSQLGALTCMRKEGLPTPSTVVCYVFRAFVLCSELYWRPLPLKPSALSLYFDFDL